jgi:hypothetical protein
MPHNELVGIELPDGQVDGPGGSPISARALLMSMAMRPNLSAVCCTALDP